MIVLDTNVVSEPLRPAGEPAVLAWLDRQDIETLFLTTISLAELRYGVAALPDGRRKEGLGMALESRVIALFGLVNHAARFGWIVGLGALVLAVLAFAMAIAMFMLCTAVLKI